MSAARRYIVVRFLPVFCNRQVIEIILRSLIGAGLVCAVLAIHKTRESCTSPQQGALPVNLSAISETKWFLEHQTFEPKYYAHTQTSYPTVFRPCSFSPL